MKNSKTTTVKTKEEEVEGRKHGNRSEVKRETGSKQKKTTRRERLTTTKTDTKTEMAGLPGLKRRSRRERCSKNRRKAY